MKLFRSLAIAAAFCMAGCATAQTAPPTPAAQTASAAGFDLSKIPLTKFAHADLQNAAAYAAGNGYPARAAFWTAIDAQVTACEAALAAAVPKLPGAGSTVGLFTAAEVAAEAIGTGIPPAVTINCNMVNLPRL